MWKAYFYRGVKIKSMEQFKGLCLNNMIMAFRLVPLICCFFVITDDQLIAQDPIKGIRELKEGYLLIRFPAFKSKIDKLNSMIAKAEEKDKMRLQKMLDSAIYERDSVRQDYIDAFKNYYD